MLFIPQGKKKIVLVRRENNFVSKDCIFIMSHFQKQEFLKILGKHELLNRSVFQEMKGILDLPFCTEPVLITF